MSAEVSPSFPKAMIPVFVPSDYSVGEVLGRTEEGDVVLLEQIYDEDGRLTFLEYLCL